MTSTVISPVISIIVTTYNGEKYIAETIETILHQTYPNWELIIVDDGSQDKTCNIVKAVQDERVHLYEAGRVGINGKLKNMGLAKARGAFIAFIDHDDLWHPAKLEKQMAALNENPGAGFCLCGGYNFRTKGEPTEYFYQQKEGERTGNIFLSIFKSEIAVWTQALLMRRECLSKTGGFNETGIFADPEFVFRLAYHYKAVLLYEPLMYRRLHDTNYTSLNWETSHKEGVEVIKSFRTKKMLPAPLGRQVLFKAYIHFGEKCIVHKKKGKAIASFIKAWWQKPFSIVPFKKTIRAIIR